MRFAYFTAKHNPRIDALLERLKDESVELYRAVEPADIIPDTDALLCLGGDGTFLSGATIAVQACVPIIGVNFGRMGFLSGMDSDELIRSLKKSDFRQEERELLHFQTDPPLDEDFWPYAVNEITLMRDGACMMGIDVMINDSPLPTYWADGLIVASGSGSTAYSLSVGGPICTPDCEVFVLSPISPHNLNVRPLVVPHSCKISISVQSREPLVALSADNRNRRIPANTKIVVHEAPFLLKHLTSDKSNFFNALSSKLLWGQDVRNGYELH